MAELKVATRVSLHLGVEISRALKFKYLLNAHQRDELESRVRQFMQYDGHVSKELDNAYIVRSLYFDNPSSHHYYEKTDGIKSRHKFRLRTYGSIMHTDTPVYLEQKGRNKERTYKHRTRIKSEELPLFYSSNNRTDLLALYPDNAVIEQFVYDSFRRDIDPVILVDYVRRPYTSNYDMNFRITFDAQLCAFPTNNLYPVSSAPWKFCNAGYTIVETKFHRRVPSWFHRMIQAYGLNRLSISKFCRGMEVCGLAKNLE